MTAALAPRTGLPGILSEDGYTPPADLTFDEWRDVLATVELIERASPWWLSDCIEYGRRRFGEDHTQAFPDAQEDPSGTRQAKLKQAAWMADRWPFGTRVPGASYTHHRIVAKLDRDEAVGLLSVATGANWSTRELAREVEARERAIPATATVEAPSCAADQPWTPTLDDVEPDWRPHVEAEARGSDEFIRGVLWAWRIAGNESMFREWRD